jgi:hypothetical protein
VKCLAGIRERFGVLSRPVLSAYYVPDAHSPRDLASISASHDFVF